VQQVGFHPLRKKSAKFSALKRENPQKFATTLPSNIVQKIFSPLKQFATLCYSLTFRTRFFYLIHACHEEARNLPAHLLMSETGITEPSVDSFLRSNHILLSKQVSLRNRDLKTNT
jgi:hypothetical protein